MQYIKLKDKIAPVIECKKLFSVLKNTRKAKEN